MDIIPILAVFKNFFVALLDISLFKIGFITFKIGHLLIGGTVFMLITSSVFRIFADGIGAPPPVEKPYLPPPMVRDDLPRLGGKVWNPRTKTFWRKTKLDGRL